MKKARRFVAMILVICLMMGQLPSSVFAALNETRRSETGRNPMENGVVAPHRWGGPENQLSWSLSADGVLTVSGTGPMPAETVPWWNDKDRITSVIIEDGVTTVSGSAFYSCDNLVSAVIGDDVTSIGSNAFYNCNLTSLKLGNSVTDIGMCAFSRCDKLTSVVIPDSVTTIGESAFSDCDSLNSVLLGSGLTVIEERSFADCESLAEITIPDHVTVIGKEAFDECESLLRVVIGDGVTDIGESAFSQCVNIADLDLGKNIVNIGNFAFFGCRKIPEILIPDSVVSIGAQAFSYCNALSVMRIPDNVTVIGQGVFSYCENLVSVTVGEGITSISNNFLAYCDSLTDVVMSSGITEIGKNAFSHCSSLKTIEISDCVTSIGEKAFQYCEKLQTVTIPESVVSIGENAFFYCSNLKGIYVDEANPNYSSDEQGGLFNKDKTLLIHAPGGRLRYTIPDGVVKIGHDAFFNSLICDIEFPESVTTIGSNAFWGCTNLFHIEIPGTVTMIEEYAFELCQCVYDLDIADGITSIGKGAFSRCWDLREVKIPGSIGVISEEAFYNCHFHYVEIGEGIHTIGKDAFRYCGNLKSILIPASVTRIDDCAFYDCKSLTTVYFTGTEEQWKNITIGTNNTALLDSDIRYNCVIQDEPGVDNEDQDIVEGDVIYFNRWDGETQTAYFGARGDIVWKTSEKTNLSFLEKADSLTGRFVMVETTVPKGGLAMFDSVVINAVPVETFLGFVTSADMQTVVIDDKQFDTPSDWTLPMLYENAEVVYHVYEGKLVGIGLLETEIGMLKFWSTEDRKITVDPDALSKGMTDYYLSTLADAGSAAFLGVTGHTNVSVRYHRDGHGFIYRIEKYVPQGGSNFYDTYVPMTEDEECFYVLVEDWMNAYGAYASAVKNAMLVSAGSDEEMRRDIISRKANAMKKNDSESASRYLSGDLGPYADQAYHALAQFLYDYTMQYAEFADTDLSDSIAGVTIVNNILKSLWGETKEYIYEDVTIAIAAFGFGSTAMGSMTIRLPDQHVYSTVTVCSTQEDSKAAIEAFVDEFSGLATNAAYQVANAVYKDILGQSLSSLTKDYVTKTVAAIEKKTAVVLSEKFQRAGVGNVIDILDECYTYYSWVCKAGNRGDLDDLKSAMDAVAELKFEDKSIRDEATDAAMRSLKKAVKTIQKAYEDYLKSTIEPNAQVYGKAFINCPVNVAIFDADGEQIGYVGSDDIWYTDAISIEDRYGAKEISSYTDELLSFEITANNFGVMSCSFEEYNDDGSPVGRLNYYNIPITPEQQLSISLSNDLEADKDSIAIITDRTAIKANEYINAADDGEAVVTCSVEGKGSVKGIGSHIRGDAVILTAIPDEGWLFAGWYEDQALVCSDDIFEFTAVDDCHVTAHFLRDDYVYVEVSAEIGGNAIGSGRYLHGDTATVIAVPEKTYSFKGWYAGDEVMSLSLEYQFTVTENVKLRAEFMCNSHTFGCPAFIWSEDAPECKAVFTCARCGTEMLLDCAVTSSTIPATETEDGCIVFTAVIEWDGQYYSESKTVVIPATGHIIHVTVLVPAVEATCQSEGNLAYYTCVGCDLWFEDEYASVVIEDHGCVTVPRKEHNYQTVVTAPTCTEQGFTTYACVCGERYTADDTAPLGHDLMAWAMVREPTTAEEGIEERKCSRCVYAERRSIPKKKNPFKDVAADSFYYDPVMWAVGKGITNGTSAETFSPNSQCMRAQVVTFLWRAAGSPEPEKYVNPFVDVKPIDYYYKAVLWALENGITSGMDATHFGSTSYCNRAQVVTFLYRTMGNPEIIVTSNPFSDVVPGSFYEKAVLWAVENGITNGISENSFGPDSVCNRAQIVTFLYRAFVV